MLLLLALLLVLLFFGIGFTAHLRWIVAAVLGVNHPLSGVHGCQPVVGRL